ncbi:MAG TPA: alpha/beta hydrolase [Acidimicrobiia bacterium]|nr:alpha/beta hydrolase [Acidimicrobiia bacterium]
MTSDRPREISVRAYGTGGVTVAVLHGGPGAPGSVASLARALAPNFHILEPLQRHSGETPLTVAQHVDDLAQVLPGRTHIVGWSWGAMLSLSFTAEHPELVSSLALVGCGTYDVTARRSYQRAMKERLGAENVARIRALTERAVTATADERSHLLDERARISNQAQSVDLVEDGTADLLPDTQGHDETWHDVIRRQEDGIEPMAFTSISSPVVMLHGDDDPHPGEATFETLQSVMPQLAYKSFRHCGHMPWLERRARTDFLETLRAWIMSHARGLEREP